MKAKTVTDVILGEATSGSRQERYEDMLSIASVVANRSQATGVSPQDVVSVRSEFNAYGQSLPSGASAYQDLARQAWEQVQREGPVHNAMFFATPAAKGNLPKGLQEVTRTSGHVFFEDPQGRSIRTAQGFAKPDNIDSRLPQQMQAPESRPTRGLGMAALAPRGLASFQEAYGPMRPGAPEQNIVDIARSAVKDALGPGYTVKGISGVGDYGSNRHGTGRAVDIQITDPQGRTLNAFNDRDAMLDVAQAAAAKGALGIGLGTDYMGARGMHVDQVQPGPGQAHTWGNLGREHRDQLVEAMNYSLMPASFYDRSLPPTTDVVPQSRPGEFAAPVGQVERGGPLGAPVDPQTAAYQQFAETMGQAGVRGLGAVPDEMPMGLVPEQRPEQLQAPVPQAKPQMAPPMPPAREVATHPVAEAPRDPNFAGSGLGAIQGLFSSPEGTRADSLSHPGVTFESRGDGTVSRDFGDGRVDTVNAGDFNAKTIGAPSGGLGNMIGGMQLGDRAKSAAMGFGLGGLPGAAVGGLFGPQIMDQIGQLGQRMGLGTAGHSSQIGGLFGGLFGGSQFPSAPQQPAGGLPAGASNLSYGDMAAISPAAAAAVVSGRGGLY